MYFKHAIFYVVNEGTSGPYANTAVDCNSDLYDFAKNNKNCVFVQIYTDLSVHNSTETI